MGQSNVPDGRLIARDTIRRRQIAHDEGSAASVDGTNRIEPQRLDGDAGPIGAEPAAKTCRVLARRGGHMVFVEASPQHVFGDDAVRSLNARDEDRSR